MSTLEGAYHNRNDSFSLSNTAWDSPKRYTHQIKSNYFQLIRLSIGKYEKNIEYIQFFLANHFLEYAREHNQPKINFGFLLKDLEFISNSKEMFKYISVTVIDKLKVPNRYKNYLYYLKDKPFPYYKHLDKISLYIQRYDFSKREMLFSFSPHAFGIPNDSDIYIFSKRKKCEKATLYNQRLFAILEKQFNDFSGNTYKAKVSLKQLLFGCEVLIVDYSLNEVISAKNPSLMLRLFKRIINSKERLKSK